MQQKKHLSPFYCSPSLLLFLWGSQHLITEPNWKSFQTGPAHSPLTSSASAVFLQQTTPVTSQGSVLHITANYLCPINKIQSLFSQSCSPCWADCQDIQKFSTARFHPTAASLKWGSREVYHTSSPLLQQSSACQGVSMTKTRAENLGSLSQANYINAQWWQCASAN